MGTIFSVYWIRSNVGSDLDFGFFCHKACELFAPQPGIEPTPPTLEVELLTTGPPGKYPQLIFTTFFFFFSISVSSGL